MPRQPILALGLLTLALALGPPARPSLGAEEAAGHPEAGRGAESHGGESYNILAPDVVLAVSTVVVFLLLLAVLRKLAWKPLLQALHQREESMEHTLEEAERARHESERLLAEHRKQMAQASEQVRALLDEARRDAESTAAEIVRKAQAEAEASRQRAEREIGNARDQALSEIWSKTAELAVAAAGRVLARELGPDDHRRLVEVATSELPSGPGGNGFGGQS